jgi:hypothetical protein
LNFQATYTLSRFDNAGSSGSATAVGGGDQDFLTSALDNNNPLRYMGPSSLDRTHQFSFGGYADLPVGLRLGIISHFYSPLATTPTVPTSDTVSGIFTNDYNGDGTNGDPLPKNLTGGTGCGTVGGSCDYTTYNVGAFGRTLKAGGLANAVNNYNGTIAGNPTPAGQTLINNELFTLAQLQALGGVTQTIPSVPAGQANIGWLRATDIKLSWVGHIKERFTIEPSVAFFNIFNFSNFDSVGNNLQGSLSGNSGTINGTPQAGRPDRIGVGSGAFNFGTPRTIEWGLKLNF